MNGEVCCILGVCCPENSPAQTDAFASELVKDGICAEPDEARKVAKWVLQHFDLAPHGTLAAFKASIAKMAKHAP